MKNSNSNSLAPLPGVQFPQKTDAASLVDWIGQAFNSYNNKGGSLRGAQLVRSMALTVNTLNVSSKKHGV